MRAPWDMEKSNTVSYDKYVTTIKFYLISGDEAFGRIRTLSARWKGASK